MCGGYRVAKQNTVNKELILMETNRVKTNLKRKPFWGHRLFFAKVPLEVLFFAVRAHFFLGFLSWSIFVMHVV